MRKRGGKMEICEKDRRKQLIRYVIMLANSVGVKQDLGNAEFHQMCEAFKSGSYKTCVALIRKQFRLTMKIQIQYFEGSYIQIGIPRDIPLYLGPESVRDSQVLIRIGSGSLQLPPEGFIYALAHEMSHIVLKCIRHELREIEEAADITAMLLGFNEIVRKGRRSDYHAAGYLSDSDFQTVYAVVRLRQNK